jgi:hypothetical protein
MVVPEATVPMRGVTRLLVSVWVSVVPTTVPAGAATLEKADVPLAVTRPAEMVAAPVPPAVTGNVPVVNTEVEAAYIAPPDVKLVRFVPPCVVAIVVPFHVPVAIVPTLDRLESVVTALLTSVPEVGSVIFVAPVVVTVSEFAPEVAKVEPLASVSVPVVVEIVRPFRLVAVAAPSVGVTSDGLLCRATTVPVPVVV